MCCRYYVPNEMTEFMLLKYLDHINRGRENGAAAVSHGEIFPTDTAPVIVCGEGGTEVTAMKWGFVSPRGPIFNARGETLDEKPMFKSAAMHRCAAFCSEYYEWKNKVKYAVRATDGGVIFLAGIYRTVPGRASEFTVVTLPPISALKELHDRMPFAIGEEAAEAWLRGRDAAFVSGGIRPLDYVAVSGE